MDIPQLTTSLWQALQPLLPVLASKGAEELAKRGVGEVWEAVKKRFAARPETQKGLDELLARPDDPFAQMKFQVQLKELLEADAAFAASLSRLLEAASSTYQASLHGDGAIAQGPGAKAVGKGGVMIGGDVKGSTIITGDGNTVEK